MTKKKEEPVDGTTEERVPKTAHEVAVGMFHGLPNILVPAKHHLTKVPGNEAKTALKAIERALGMVAECTTKLAKVPGPIRANFKDSGTFVIVESDTNRVTADGSGLEFQQVNLLHRRNSTCPWIELVAWDAAEWRTPGSEAFEAIIGIIAKIVAGVEVDPAAFWFTEIDIDEISDAAK